jgi:hypothetical protein
MGIQFRSKLFELTEYALAEAELYGHKIVSGMKSASKAKPNSCLGLSPTELMVVCLASIEEESRPVTREAFLCALAILMSDSEQEKVLKKYLGSDEELVITTCPESGVPFLMSPTDLASLSFQFCDSKIAFKMPKGIVALAIESLCVSGKSDHYQGHREMALFQAGRVYTLKSEGKDFSTIAPAVSLMAAHVILSGGGTSVSTSMAQFFLHGSLNAVINFKGFNKKSGHLKGPIPNLEKLH